MNFSGLRAALVGPLPPPAGGMANQTWQLAELLRQEGASVELVQVNVPYRPAWVERFRGLRALVRLFPYGVALWRAAGRADIVHVMASSGWAWHLFAAPAVWIGRARGRPVVVNYHGGEAEGFLQRSAARVRPTVRRASQLLFPSPVCRRLSKPRNFQLCVMQIFRYLTRFILLRNLDTLKRRASRLRL